MNRKSEIKTKGTDHNVLKAVIKLIVILICIGNIFWYMISAIVTIGSVVGTAFFTVAGAAALFWDNICTVADTMKKRRGTKALLYTVTAVICAGLLFIAGCLGAMAFAAARTPSGDATLVVLGCKVNGTVPSLMLQKRIEAAYTYLSGNPGAVCIASGGQGSDEDISEARCIYNGLTQMGISPERIYLEEKSTNTRENLLFSRQIIESKGLPSEIAVATDGFHELRAAMIASKLGFRCTSVPARTPLYLASNFTTREILAVAAELLKR